MKALAFLQPWAHSVLYLNKKIDNRSRKDGKMPGVCHHRGPLLIHASGLESNAYYRLAADWILKNTGHELPPWLVTRGGIKNMPRGGIVGRCNVVGHVEPNGIVWWGQDSRKPIAKTSYTSPSEFISWHMPGSYGLVLADVEPLPFVPWKGSLGLFEVPESALVSV